MRRVQIHSKLARRAKRQRRRRARCRGIGCVHTIITDRVRVELQPSFAPQSPISVRPSGCYDLLNDEAIMRQGAIQCGLISRQAPDNGWARRTLDRPMLPLSPVLAIPSTIPPYEDATNPWNRISLAEIHYGTQPIPVPPPQELTLTEPMIQQVRDRLSSVESGYYGQLNDAMRGRLPRQAAIECRDAYDRARDTLRLYLSDTEKQQLEQRGYFEVPSRLSPGRVYRIPVSEGTVSVLDNDIVTMTMCARPEDDSVPWPDVMLAYKLGLQADEERWLATANKWPTDWQNWREESRSRWLYDEYIGGERLNAIDLTLNGALVARPRETEWLYDCRTGFSARPREGGIGDVSETETMAE